MDPVLALLFASRGVDSIQSAYPTLEHVLPTAELLNCDRMGEYLAECRVGQKLVCIVGDYDCDGATATAVLNDAFAASGMDFGFMVPDRGKHGYGLKPPIVDQIANLPTRPEVIITVDNGISCHAGVDRARELGITVLITDHHIPGATLPDAEIIVNPNQALDRFESKSIAGCGVAWYVVRAYHRALERRGISPGFDPNDLLPYVAIGTVADLVPLDVNNRALVREGLARIREGRCSQGIAALAAVAGRSLEELTTEDIGFSIAPRINAAGRLTHMSTGINCLTGDDYSESFELARELDEINTRRKELQKAMEMEAQAAVNALSVAADALPKCIVVYKDSFRPGVIGVVAGKLKEANHRPTFVLGDNEQGTVSGSGRSIDGFHLKHCLEKIDAERPGLFLSMGGHAMAAGVTVSRERVAEFAEALLKVCESDLADDLLERVVEHDGAYPSRGLTPAAIRRISSEVWGQGFWAPLFRDTLVVNGIRLMGQDKTHMKLDCRVSGVGVDVVAFGMAKFSPQIAQSVDIVYRPSVNHFNRRDYVQFIVRAFPSLNEPVSEPEPIANVAAGAAPSLVAPPVATRQETSRPKRPLP